MVKWKGWNHILLQCYILDLTHKDKSTKYCNQVYQACCGAVLGPWTYPNYKPINQACLYLPTKILDITATGNLSSLTDGQVNKLRETKFKSELDNFTSWVMFVSSRMKGLNTMNKILFCYVKYKSDILKKNVFASILNIQLPSGTCLINNKQ
jgi:hypothetical protein